LDAATREPNSLARWSAAVREAEAGKLDFLTFEGFAGPRPTDAETDPLAALVASRFAPVTSRIGLIPAISGSVEPIQIAKSIARLDDVSSGRAGWHVAAEPPGAINPIDTVDTVGAIDTVAEVMQAARALWDGRLQRPVVTTLARTTPGYRFAARWADVAFVAPFDVDEVRQIIDEVRTEQAAADRDGEPLRVFADLVVFLDQTESAARERKARLDDRAGTGFNSDAMGFVGTPAQLMAQLQSWQRTGIDGFRLRPAELPHDLRAITRGLVPMLQENDAFRRGYETKTLRSLLGLPRLATRASSA
jgi:alkanesulfonate monooxygenase SsuD/methylene tetrahydromethanopterin reductase-like flavin-dependent oxidoreductase (luciferase family)